MYNNVFGKKEVKSVYLNHRYIELMTYRCFESDNYID